MSRNPFEVISHDLSEEPTSRAIDVQHRLMVATNLFIFQIGFAIFEYGGVRKKNSEYVLMRQFLIFCVSALGVFTFGFGVAYGEPYLIGNKYLLSLKIIHEEYNSGSDQQLATNYLHLLLFSSISSNLAMSAISERGGTPSLRVWMLYTLILSCFVVPIVTAWTFANGFLQQLQSFTIDQAGCLCIHLTAGITAFVACFILPVRLGRFEPIPIKKRF